MRALTDFLKKSIMYQMHLRVFTKEGTLKAAQEKLAGLKEIGVNIVYLCAINESDDDMDKKFWSHRQKMCGAENPCNPYRAKDYFKIDSEYGTHEDFKEFVNTAHTLGIKVLVDLVYLHCGPQALLLKQNKDFIKRDENGEIKLGDEWTFPQFNFECFELREIFYNNMEFYLDEFKVDGFRCDCGDRIPLDFWEEARKRLDIRKPDIIMLNEGQEPPYTEFAFDLNYFWPMIPDMSALKLPVASDYFVEYNKRNFPCIRMLENHDTAHDDGENRVEKVYGHDGVEANLVLNYAIDGVPCLYNGVEVCDDSKHCIFTNRYHNQLLIDWSLESTQAAKYRKELLVKLAEIKRANSALFEGETKEVVSSNPEKIITFTRTSHAQKAFCAVNIYNEKVTCQVPCFEIAKELIAKGYDVKIEGDITTLTLKPYGYLVAEVK